ncbi:MAG: YciI family protein [Polyangiaceae bacterium]
MKYVLFYEAAADFRSRFPAHFAEHQSLWGAFRDAGTLLMIGPFTDEPAGSALAIFTTREAAQAFVEKDPFVRHGLVSQYRIREWQEALCP